MSNNINYLEEIAIFIEKIKQLSQQKINNYQLFTECFNLLKNFKSNIEHKQQQLYDKFTEIKERLVKYEYSTYGDSLQDADQFKKIELYLKQLANIMITDYIIINNNCINFLLLDDDKQKLVELFTFNYAINCKVVAKLIIEGNIKKIKLLTNIITLEKIIDDYNKLLYVATMHNQIDILKHLLKISIDKKRINVLNQNGLTVFTCAIINGKLAAAKILLDHGAAVNHKNKDGITALVFAITKGDLEIVKFLLDHGANINIKNKDGNTPLMFAANLKCQNKIPTSVLITTSIGAAVGIIIGPTVSIVGALIGAIGGSFINKKDDSKKNESRNNIFDVIAVAANNIDLSIETTTEAKNINSL